MRMGSDAGRDFLATKDPVRRESPGDGCVGPKTASTVARPVSLADILEQYFRRGTKKRGVNK